MAKLLRKTKRRGRCTVPGHSIKNCEVCQEIQTDACTRAIDKAEAKREIESQLKDTNE